MKSLRNLWFWKDVDMRARRSANVAFMVLFDRDPSVVVHGCWFANKGGEMKSLDFTTSLNSYGFLVISGRARAHVFCFEKLGAKTLGVYMFS